MSAAKCMNDAMRAALGLTMLLLAGCSPEPHKDRSQAPPAPSAAPKKLVAPAAAPATQPLPAPAATERKLAVEAEGLRLFDAKTGAARALPFGMERERLLPILEAFRGPADTGENSECGAGPLDYAAWADGLTLQFQEGRFAGWALDERAEGAHSTASGIGPGSTRAALDSVSKVEIEQTSLGTEFSAGSLYGVLSGPGRQATIKAMWAGVSCVFR